jgi:hypothetical protein
MAEMTHFSLNLASNSGKLYKKMHEILKIAFHANANTGL